MLSRSLANAAHQDADAVNGDDASACSVHHRRGKGFPGTLLMRAENVVPVGQRAFQRLDQEIGR